MWLLRGETMSLWGADLWSVSKKIGEPARENPSLLRGAGSPSSRYLSKLIARLAVVV